MSSINYIGRLRSDNQVAFAYCHKGAHMEDNGAILQEFYTNTKDVAQLISGGCMASLGEYGEPDYYWDRGECEPDEGIVITVEPFPIFSQSLEWIHVESIFLWDGQEWLVKSTHHTNRDDKTWHQLASIHEVMQSIESKRERDLAINRHEMWGRHRERSFIRNILNMAIVVGFLLFSACGDDYKMDRVFIDDLHYHTVEVGHSHSLENLEHSHTDAELIEAFLEKQGIPTETQTPTQPEPQPEPKANPFIAIIEASQQITEMPGGTELINIALSKLSSGAKMQRLLELPDSEAKRLLIQAYAEHSAWVTETATNFGVIR